MDKIQHTAPPFDAFKILDSDLNEMPIMHAIPPGCEGYIIPGSTVYSTTGKPGTFLFQQIAYPDYTFWISNYFTNVKEKILGSFPESSMEVHFILSGDLLYRLKRFDWQKLTETQYNLLCVPYIENEVYFDNKNYFTFDIHPSIQLLEKIAPNLSRLKGFIQRVRKGHPAQLFDSHQFASAKMLYSIKCILDHLKNKKAQAETHILDKLVYRLIKLAVSNNKGRLKSPVNFFDVERIYTAENNMITYMDDEKILAKEIRSSHIDKAKFRKGFQQIFDALPNAYLKHQRMEKATDLLEHRTDLKIKEIAERVGYLNPDNFSTIYKIFSGLSPREFRNSLRF